MKLKIKIPENVDLLVTTGQDVDFNTPFFNKISTQSQTIPVASLLKFEPEKIFLNLRKLVGEPLQPGDLIAEHKTTFSTKQYYSETQGIIKEVNHMTGSIVIESESSEKSQYLCFFQGHIEAIADNYIELKVKKYKEFDIVPLNHYFGAKVFYLSEQTNIITEEDVDNTFICASSVKPIEQAKLEALGAVGLISPPNGIQSPALLDVVLQQQTDFDNVFQLQYPYCLIGEKQDTIFFYE